MLKFKKFPHIEHQGQVLVWDSRQFSSSAPERIYLNPDLTEELRKTLRTRPAARAFVESESMRRLGADASEALSYPSRALRIVGVTGTNGKTSCTHIMAFVLAALGRRVMQVGTLGVQIWESDSQGSAHVVYSEETGFTTPEAPSLHDLFRQALDVGVTHVVMEVSSHAMALNRVSGVEFDGVIFTNLSQDHLDFHGDMKSYGAAKRLLFERELEASPKPQKFAVLAAPDESSQKFFLDDLTLASDIERVELRLSQDFDLSRVDLDGFSVALPGEGELATSLIGAHNAWNVVMSFKALNKLEGVSLKDFEEAMQSYSGTPGRFERVAGRCFVDYAHSPDALEKALGALRSSMSGAEKLIVVFGCGGDRDRGKRPLMGEIAGRLADVVWLTNDNPRTEDPSSILAEIRAGVGPSSQAELHVCPERAEAIESAIRAAKPEDVVIVCGKGHEDYQIVGTKKFPFSDQDCIRKCLQSSAGPAR